MRSERGMAAEALLIVTGIAILGGIIYLGAYARRTNGAGDSTVQSAQNNLKAGQQSPAQLAASLALAESKLSKQNALLAAMKAGFPSSPALDSQVNDAYSAAAAVVAKTDPLFNDPDSASPTLKDASADPAAAAAIAQLRQQINAALAAWKADSGSAGSTLALSQQALSDLNAMQSYVSQLQNYFAALPPSTELQADVILTYQQQLSDEAAAVNNAIDTVSSIGGPVIADASSPADSGSDPGDSDNSGTNGNDTNGNPPSNNSSDSDNGSQPPTDQPPADLPPVITVADVQTQQQTVDQTTNQIDQIQQQIQDAGSGNQSSSDQNPSDQNNSSDSNNSSFNADNSDDSGDGGSVQQLNYQAPDDSNQSTGPQLIQGSNPF